MQQTSYSLDAPQGDTVLIHKSLKLKTTENSSAEPRLELTGDGATIFDLKEGLPQKVTFTGTFTMREQGQTLQVPVSLQCERITGSEAQTATAATAPGIAAAAPVVPPESPESAKARLDGFLADLRAGDKDWGKYFQALQGLILMPPVDSRRNEVAEVLNDYLVEKNYSARSSALRAVQTWGTKRNVPALVRLLAPSESDSIRRRAIDVLGSLGDEALRPPSHRGSRTPRTGRRPFERLRGAGRRGRGGRNRAACRSGPRCPGRGLQAAGRNRRR